ncbi:GNAT family N-acetyltransferase [Caenispirillum salinarum]|uniref:GNAT family N-acetyltransferase n=1 Tax=Caenispirillum salinarum TaxID=859058 RepID=UPI00384E034C
MPTLEHDSSGRLSRFRLAPITARDTIPLRHAVLRPMQPLEACHYAGDAAATTYHAGAWAEGDLIGVASVFREAEDGSTDGPDWRIRGMAVEAPWRGQGVGAALLRAVIAHCALQQDGGLLWCNARTAVEPFYRRFGFVREGQEFDLPPLGPHIRLHRPLGMMDRALRM